MEAARGVEFDHRATAHSTARAGLRAPSREAGLRLAATHRLAVRAELGLARSVIMIMAENHEATRPAGAPAWVHLVEALAADTLAAEGTVVGAANQVSFNFPTGTGICG